MGDEKQVRTNISTELHGKVTRAARRLGKTMKEYLANALQEKHDRFDADLQIKRLRACNTTLSAEKEQFRKERNTAQQKLQEQIRKTSGLPEECDRLERAKTSLMSERDEARHERNAACQQRDHFKGKYEEANASVAKLEADLDAHKRRGFWDRVFNRDVSG